MSFTSPISATQNNSIRLVSLAVLYQSGQFLLQLRDNKPDILYPGYWGLFGGHLEPGETPEAGLLREVQEEIGYELKKSTFFGRYDDEIAYRYVFYAPLTASLHQLVLQEGWDMDFLSPAAIAQGYYYSDKAQEERPLGPIHQKILLDFIKAGLK